MAALFVANCPNCHHDVGLHTETGCGALACRCPLDKQAAMRCAAVAAAILYTREED